MENPELGRLVWDRLLRDGLVELAARRRRSAEALSLSVGRLLGESECRDDAASALFDLLMRAPEVEEVFGDEQAVSDVLAALEEECAGLFPWADEGEAERAPSCSNPALEDAIREQPDDPERYLVYADWLQAQGDPRGQLIVLDEQLLRTPADARLQAARGSLLERHREHFLGRLADHTTTSERDEEDRQEAFAWHLGFIRRARFAYGGPSHDVASLDLAELVAYLGDHPSGRFLRELAIGENRLRVYHQSEHAPVVAALAARSWPTLRLLSLGDVAGEAFREVRLGDLSRLWPSLPALEELSLRGVELRLGAPVLPALRSLRIEVADLSQALLGAAGGVQAPRLERLSIGGDAEGELEVAALAPLARARELRELALTFAGSAGPGFSDALAALLVEEKIVHRLERLDLASGNLSDDGLARLLRDRAALAGLRHLDLSQNTLGPEAIARLRAAFPGLTVAADWQRARGEPLDRYDDVRE
jgi:uncharacterized protein (TIGR02996 family)